MASSGRRQRGSDPTMRSPADIASSSEIEDVDQILRNSGTSGGHDEEFRLVVSDESTTPDVGSDRDDRKRTKRSKKNSEGKKPFFSTRKGRSRKERVHQSALRRPDQPAGKIFKPARTMRHLGVAGIDQEQEGKVDALRDPRNGFNANIDKYPRYVNRTDGKGIRKADVLSMGLDVDYEESEEDQPCLAAPGLSTESASAAAVIRTSAPAHHGSAQNTLVQGRYSSNGGFRGTGLSRHSPSTDGTALHRAVAVDETASPDQLGVVYLNEESE